MRLLSRLSEVTVRTADGTLYTVLPHGQWVRKGGKPFSARDAHRFNAKRRSGGPKKGRN